MQRIIRDIFDKSKERLLVLTGVRIGESAVRDQRIALSCSKDGSECGQGWYQEALSDDICNKLAPLLHWRVCNIWDWLKIIAPMPEYGGWDTTMLADAYGGEEAEEINARTGCIGCPLATKDSALDAILMKFPQWAYLKPLKGLKPIYRELRKPQNRLRQPGTRKLKNGSLESNPNRMGPLTMEARRWALDRIVSIQEAVNRVAKKAARPEIDIINEQEIERINQLMENNTWPRGWTGKEPLATKPYEQIYKDGSRQTIMKLS